MKLNNNQLTISPINQLTLNNEYRESSTERRETSHKRLLIMKNSICETRETSDERLSFMQNEPKFKIASIYASPCNTSGYSNFRNFCRPKNEPKRTQNEPNFSPKLASFFPKLASFREEIFAFAKKRDELKPPRRLSGANYRPIIAMPSLSARVRVSGLSRIRTFPASTTRHLPPFSERALIVSVPTQGTSKRISWFGLDTFIRIHPPFLQSEPARKSISAVPSMASTANISRSFTAMAWPISRPASFLTIEKPNSISPSACIGGLCFVIRPLSAKCSLQYFVESCSVIPFFSSSSARAQRSNNKREPALTCD